LPGLSHEDVETIFTFHPPKDEETGNRHDRIREVCRTAAHHIKDLTPDSAEQTTAIRKLQEAMMHANAAVAIHG